MSTEALLSWARDRAEEVAAGIEDPQLLGLLKGETIGSVRVSSGSSAATTRGSDSERREARRRRLREEQDQAVQEERARIEARRKAREEAREQSDAQVAAADGVPTQVEEDESIEVDMEIEEIEEIDEIDEIEEEEEDAGENASQGGDETEESAEGASAKQAETPESVDEALGALDDFDDFEDLSGIDQELDAELDELIDAVGTEDRKVREAKRARTERGAAPVKVCESEVTTPAKSRDELSDLEELDLDLDV